MITLQLSEEESALLADLISERSKVLEEQSSDRDYNEVVTLLGISQRMLPVLEEEERRQKFLRMRYLASGETIDEKVARNIRESPEYKLLESMNEKTLVVESFGVALYAAKKYLIPIGTLVKLVYNDFSDSEEGGKGV